MAERDVEIDIASPKGGKAVWLSWSDPNSPDSLEPRDIVSKGFLSDKTLVEKVATTLPIGSLDLDQYDAIHFVGGGGAAIDLYPNGSVKCWSTSSQKEK